MSFLLVGQVFESNCFMDNLTSPMQRGLRIGLLSAVGLGSGCASAIRYEKDRGHKVSRFTSIIPMAAGLGLLGNYILGFCTGYNVSDNSEMLLGATIASSSLTALIYGVEYMRDGE
jgi:hypothetical protein